MKMQPYGRTKKDSNVKVTTLGLCSYTDPDLVGLPYILSCTMLSARDVSQVCLSFPGAFRKRVGPGHQKRKPPHLPFTQVLDYFQEHIIPKGRLLLYTYTETIITCLDQTVRGKCLTKTRRAEVWKTVISTPKCNPRGKQNSPSTDFIVSDC